MTFMYSLAPSRCCLVTGRFFKNWTAPRQFLWKLLSQNRPAMVLPPSMCLMELIRDHSIISHRPNAIQWLSNRRTALIFSLDGNWWQKIKYFNNFIIILQKFILISTSIIIIHQFKVKMALILPQNLLTFLHQARIQAACQRQRISHQFVPHRFLVIH